MPAKKKPGDSFRLPHRRHEYFNFFVPQPLGVVPMCESGRNILAKHKKSASTPMPADSHDYAVGRMLKLQEGSNIVTEDFSIII